jgi:hypothetical protein
MGTTSAATSKSQTRQAGSGGAMVDETRDTTSGLANRAQEKVTEQVRAGVNKGTNRAADTLGSVAQSLLVSSQQLRDQDRGTIGDYVERAANKVEQLADYVQNTNASQFAERVEGFARREPALFLGGAFALGLVGARFLKSSRQPPQRRPESPAYQTTSTPSWQRDTETAGTLADREVPITRTSPAGPEGFARY